MAAGIDHRLSLSEALASPCSTCVATPCCTHLPVQSVGVSTLIDLDYVRYLLNFDNLVVTLAPSGEWSVFLHGACRHLDTARGQCRVHAQPDQPHICSTYNPYTCWYKGALGEDPNADLLRIDRVRWQFVADRTVFDADRRIVDAPSWDDLSAAFSDPGSVNPGHRRSPAIEMATVPDVPVRFVARASATETARFPPSPCTDCEAPCCTNVVFPYPVPDQASNLDFLRFALGFPGVRLLAGVDGWGLAVTATCRHLDGGRCSAFGLPERPLRCTYYDEWSCTFKPAFSATVAKRVPLLDLAAFVELLPMFLIDEEGRIAKGPSDAQITSVAQGGPAGP